ncbi:Histidine kinase [Burkholderia diffusa]|nr:Histidine kinase [Burkholderia diffusa]
MPLLRETLDELRRYHRLLMTGACWAAALVMVIALIADVTLLVRAYIGDQHDMFTIAYRLVRGRVTANENSFLNGLARAELSWGDERPVPASLVKRFRAGGNLMYWKPFPEESLELLITAAPDAQLSAAEIADYIEFATQVSRASIAMSKVRGWQATKVFFSPDRKVVAIMPSSSIDRPERLTNAAGRAAFVKELTEGAEDLAAGAAPPRFRNAVHWSSRLYPLPDGRMVLRLAAPILHRGVVKVVLVDEVDPSDLVWPMLDGAYEGVYAVVNANGDVIATASRDRPDQALLDRVSQWQRAHGAGAHKVTEYRDGGRYLISQRIGDTDFSLVYTYSWRDVAAAVRGEVFATAGIAMAVLAAIWLMLHLLSRRVFRPMYARSEQVFESERLSRTVIETAPVGLGLVSTENGALLHGGSSLHALGNLLEDGIAPLLAELSKRYARLKSARGSVPDKVFQEDMTLRTIDGSEIALQARFALGRYLGKDVLVTAFVDVTASRALQRQLRDAKVAADQASAAKSAFLATMSHEIRTPLNAILGNLELLGHSPLNPLQRDRLRTIRASSNGLLAIIQDVLDFSKVEAGEMQFERIPFKVADVITRALSMFSPVAQAKGVALYGRFGPSIDQIMQGDPARLAQVVHNLLSNAIKFTAEGKVTLDVAYAAPVGEKPTGGVLVVTVADTGIGIDTAQRAQLFKAFAQADSSISRRFGGTGLGLALCQRLTAGMGGTIVFDGEAGKGSRFSVRIPLDRSDSGGTAIVPDARIFVGQRVTLLAAADDWHAYAATLIEAWGAVVDAVHHPDEVAEASGCLLVICGDRSGWSADSENRLVEECAAVINCSVSGPLRPVRVGRVLTVSCYSPAGLRTALDHRLNGKPLAPLDDAYIAQTDVNGNDGTTRRLGLHVLVAEDNDVNQRLLEEQLSLLGCSARIVADGVDALQVLSDESFDVVLTDLHMPRMDGYVLAQIMRVRWPHTPIVAVTADVAADEHRRCDELGVRAVMSKPISLDDLARVLTQAVGGTGSHVGAAGAAGGALLGAHAMPPSLVDAFRKSCMKSLDVLRAAQARGDAPAMLAELHSLKGALGIFQQRDLGQQCGALERRIKAAGLEHANVEWQTFEQALAALLSDRSHQGRASGAQGGDDAGR